MSDIHIGIVGPVGAGKTTLAQAMTARSSELFPISEEDRIKELDKAFEILKAPTIDTNKCLMDSIRISTMVSKAD